MKKRVLWVIDPWLTLDHPRDTTLRLIEASLKAPGVKTEQWICEVSSIAWSDERGTGRATLDAKRVIAIRPARSSNDFELSEAKTMRPSEFSQIHYRVDPPVDHAWTHPLQILILDLGTREADRRIVNPATVLLGANEKIEAGALAKHMPASVAAADRSKLLTFLRAHGRVVLKPLHQAQSKGIELLSASDPMGAESMLRVATEGFKRPVLLQQFLEGISEGEVRLWFAGAKLIAFVRKHPVRGDFRVNMDAGSGLSPITRLSARESKAADAIAKHLRSRKIKLAAVDLIEGLVTDFNFTSPGLIPQMEQVLGEDLATQIVRRLR